MIVRHSAQAAAAMGRRISHGTVRTALILILNLALALASGIAVPEAGASDGYAASGWRIRIKSAACVQGDRVLLGEVAEAVGEIDPATWDELAATVLWRGPQRHGRMQFVTRNQLQQALGHYLGAVAESCILPSRLAIQRGGRVYTSMDIRKRTVEFLTRAAAGLDGDPEFTDWQLPTYIFLPETYDELRLALKTERLEPGRVGLSYHVRSPDGRISRRSAGSVFLNLWRAVPCAAEPIRRGETVQHGKLTFRRKNVAHYSSVWDGKGGPWRMTRAVGLGQPIDTDWLEPVPMVAEGDTVILSYETGRVHLAVKARAMNDGDLGEQVEVRNLQSDRVVTGTVIGKNKVGAR